MLEKVYKKTPVHQQPKYSMELGNSVGSRLEIPFSVAGLMGLLDERPRRVTRIYPRIAILNFIVLGILGASLVEI